MIYTPLTKKAIKLMYLLHKNQADKSGLPYVFHPWHVAECMDDEIKTTVALLRDVVEDTDITPADLKHNSDLDRLDHVSAKDTERKEKYAKAIRILEDYNDNPPRLVKMKVT